MKTYLIQASIACAALAVSNLAGAQPASFGAEVSGARQANAPTAVSVNSSTQLSKPAVVPPSGQITSAAAVAAGVPMPVPSQTSAQLSTIPRPATTAALGPGEREVSPKAKQLEALQEEIPLWKAKAEIAKYRADVAKAEQSMAGTLATPLPNAGQATQIAQGPLPISIPVQAAATDDKGAGDGIRLLTLRAFDGQYDAIVDNNGSIITVRVGDPIGAWKVTAIGSAGVKLTSGKRVRTLGL